MAGYWPRSIFASLWTSTPSQKKRAWPLSSYGAAECSIGIFEFNVNELVQVNPDNLRAMSASINIFNIQIEHTVNKNRQTLSQSKPWCNDSGILNLRHGYYTTTMISRRFFRQNPVSRGTNQPIRKSEFVQCMTVE